MDPTVMVRHLTNSTNNASILCRVIKSWDIKYPSTGRCKFMRYLLVDTEGAAIEAEITKADEKLLKLKPTDGEVYLFSQFRVEVPTTGYNATGHDYIIHMTAWTEIIEVQRPALEPPTFYFNFKEFEEIGTTVRGSRTVVDVIGRITSIGPVQEINAPNGLAQIRDIMIANTRDKTLRVTLWTTFLPMIDEVAIFEASKQAPLVFAFSSLELRFYRGEPFLKTYTATKIYTDQNQPQIAKYLQLFDSAAPVNTIERRVFQPSKQSKMTVPIETTLKNLITLEPYSNKDQQFSCVAQIETIVNQDSWCYSACPECKVSTYCDGDPIKCHKCHATITSTTQWYRLVLQVTDDNAVAEFTLIGKQAESIVTKKADLVFAEARRINKMIPPSLENIYGKRFLFTVDINTLQLHKQHITYDVNKIGPVPATFPTTSVPSLLPPNIHEDHFLMASASQTGDTHAERTGLSPQTTLLSINSATKRCSPSLSESSRQKKKFIAHPKEENVNTSASIGNDSANADDAGSTATTP